MSKQYFKNKNDHKIIIKNESLKTILFQTGFGFLIITTVPWFFFIGEKLTLASWLGVLATTVSTIIFLSSFFFKPVYTVFNKDTGFVSFHSEKINFEVPFSQIQFVRMTTPSATYRMRYHEVRIYALSDSPIFPNQKIINERKPFSHYETLLCTYRCSSKDQAENSIEQLQRFMGALPPEVEGASKFDSLLE